MTNQEPTSPGPYARLTVKYVLIGLYGLAASLVGITTIDEVAGREWGLAWPVLVTLCAAAAIFALNRSKMTGRYGWEIACTILLIAHLCSYSIYIVTRTLGDGDVVRLPIALLPVIICVGPFARVLDIARKK